MAKRIVVGLDPSEHCKSAQNFALLRAKMYDGVAIGVAVVDVVGIERAEAGGAVGAGHHAHRAEQYHLDHARETCRKLVADFEALAAQVGARCETVIEEGRPFEVISHVALSADLVVTGTRTFFHHETQDAPGDTVRDLLHAKACPLFVVPPRMQVPGNLIFAYDGSVPAARTMRMFNHLTAGISVAENIILLTVCDDEAAAKKLMEAPLAYLRAYGRDIQPVVVPGSPKQAVEEYVMKHMPAVVALGASSRGALAEFFMGSVPKALLNNGTIPLFIAN